MIDIANPLDCLTQLAMTVAVGPNFHYQQPNTNNQTPAMHFLTYIFTGITLSIFGLLPLPVASWLGGRLAQCIGPRTRRHQVALKNLALIFPDKPQEWRNKTAMDMWGHMGRVVGELPSLRDGKLASTVGTIEGAQHLTAAGQAIFVSAHLGQWELLTPVAKQHGVGPIASMYRHVNNHRVDALLKSYRSAAHDELIRKKGDNAIALVRALKGKKSLALLIDQRLTKGDMMPFLGVEAPTNTAAIRLSIKTGVPIMVAFIIREQGVSFAGIVHAPIYPPEQGTEDEKTAQMARQVFNLIEAQIHAHPNQYMWTHDRWKH